MTRAASSRSKLYELIETTLGEAPGTVDGAASPATLSKWDSLNHLNVVLALESEYGVSFAPEDVLDMRTVELIETILRERGIELS